MAASCQSGHMPAPLGLAEMRLCCDYQTRVSGLGPHTGLGLFIKKAISLYPCQRLRVNGLKLNQEEIKKQLHTGV